jgi:hypothetical protein
LEASFTASFTNDSIEEDITSVASVAKPVKKRLNKKRYRANLFPRIIKRDIRRLYPRMLANAMNEGNPKILAAFFATFARADCLVDKQYQDENNSMVRANFRSLEMMLLNFSVHCDLVPDVTVDLHRSTIHQFRIPSEHKNTPIFSSEILCEMVISGTKIYSYDRATASDLAIEAEDFLLREVRGRATSIDSDEAIENYGLDSHASSLQGFVPANVPPSIAQRKILNLRNPLAINMRGGIRLTMDEENNISGVFCVL